MAEMSWTGANAIGPIFAGVLSDAFALPSAGGGSAGGDGDSGESIRLALLVASIIPAGGCQ